MGKKQKTRIELDEVAVTRPLIGDLLRGKGFVQAAKEEPEPARKTAPEETCSTVQDLSSVSRIVLQFERKGHGGKQATRVEGLPFNAEALGRLARDLRRDMGCGAWVEGETILLQGDLTERLKDWFGKKGVRRIVISGRGGIAG
jgi:translation initiation factor 1 (eIF-1/SUI1)